MGISDRLRQLFSGAKKAEPETLSVGEINSALSARMKSATELWWYLLGDRHICSDNMGSKPLPMAYTSTAYIAQLVTGEIKFELADERLNEYAQRNLMPNLDRITQLTLAGGYTVIKPYMTKTGEIFFDVGTSRDFLPIELDQNGRIINGIFFERTSYKGKIYERREHHIFKDGVHTVNNSAVLYGTSRAAQLSDIPKWAALLPHGAIRAEIPMIATYRTPYANNIDLDSKLPISMYANSVSTLSEIDLAHSDYRAEFKKMSAKIFADETVLAGKKGIPDDYFVAFEGDGTSSAQQQIMVFAPQIRENELKSAFNTELRLYETEIGVSSGTFTFDSQRGLVTATQILSEDRTTYNTICQLQRQLRTALESLNMIIITLARFYGLECEDGKCAIEFGDSVFEDTRTEFDMRMQMVQNGLLKAEDFYSWYFGVPIEKARERLPLRDIPDGDRADPQERKDGI